MINKNKKGFTLVELVVVIAVLLILAAIAIPTVTGVINDAQESTDLSNAKAIETAIKYAIAENEIGSSTAVTTVSGALGLSGMDTSVLSCRTASAYFAYNATTDTVILVTGTSVATGYTSITGATTIG